ncbi:hypothetical protein PC128_g5117 [Phytophthora cactorum]|nr:hypothetical protein PC128_g5117 [Phytophthora cactorum]
MVDTLVPALLGVERSQSTNEIDDADAVGDEGAGPSASHDSMSNLYTSADDALDFFPWRCSRHHFHTAKQNKDSDGREVCDASDAHARRHEGGGFICTRTFSSKCRHEGDSDEQRRPRCTDEPRRERH